MSTGTRVAGCLCLILAGGVARASEATSAPGGGLSVDRLSKRDLRHWRAIETVVAASDPTGAPRSPTLRRLWDWARSSSHLLRVEMVSPFQLPNGFAGNFRVEHHDPAGLRHVGVIRLCPRNIVEARVSAHPDMRAPFVRFEGLTEAERLAEVLAHELAHAQQLLENPEKLAEALDAQAAIAVTFSREGKALEPVLEKRVRQCEKPLAVLAAGEAHAETVEGVVFRELAASAPPSVTR